MPEPTPLKYACITKYCYNTNIVACIGDNMLRKIGTTQGLSDAALEIVAARFKALGDPTRLKLVQLLFAGEKSVLELCSLTKMSQANISKHLSILSEQGLLGRRKEGLYVYYSIADDSLFDMCSLVCESLSDRFNKAQNEFKTKAARKAR